LIKIVATADFKEASLEGYRVICDGIPPGFCDRCLVSQLSKLNTYRYVNNLYSAKEQVCIPKLIKCATKIGVLWNAVWFRYAQIDLTST
jgi:hypothetical protein